jgi:hypothetical protein
VVLNEMRLLSSRDYDSRTLLYVILAGDGRLLDGRREPEKLAHRAVGREVATGHGVS